jgi:hypothetical protein
MGPKKLYIDDRTAGPLNTVGTAEYRGRFGISTVREEIYKLLKLIAEREDLTPRIRDWGLLC